MAVCKGACGWENVFSSIASASPGGTDLFGEVFVVKALSRTGLRGPLSGSPGILGGLKEQHDEIQKKA